MKRTFTYDNNLLNNIDDTNEIWKDIKGYEGYYQVSNLGRVRSIDRVITYKDGRKTLRRGQFTNQHFDRSHNYLLVRLSKNDHHKNFTVHRVVAAAFIPNPNNYPQVNHKDENKLNNCADNLEWCTSQYNNTYNGINIKHGKTLKEEYDNGTMPKRGEIKIVQLDKNGNMIKIWRSMSEAERILGTDTRNISDIVHHKHNSKRKSAPIKNSTGRFYGITYQEWIEKNKKKEIDKINGKQSA